MGKIARCPQCRKKTYQIIGLGRDVDSDNRGLFYGLTSIHRCDVCDIEVFVTEKWRLSEFECVIYDRT